MTVTVTRKRKRKRCVLCSCSTLRRTLTCLQPQPTEPKYDDTTIGVGGARKIPRDAVHAHAPRYEEAARARLHAGGSAPRAASQSSSGLGRKGRSSTPLGPWKTAALSRAHEPTVTATYCGGCASCWGACPQADPKSSGDGYLECSRTAPIRRPNCILCGRRPRAVCTLEIGRWKPTHTSKPHPPLAAWSTITLSSLYLL